MLVPPRLPRGRPGAPLHHKRHVEQEGQVLEGAVGQLVHQHLLDAAAGKEGGRGQRGQGRRGEPWEARGGGEHGGEATAQHAAPAAGAARRWLCVQPPQAHARMQAPALWRPSPPAPRVAFVGEEPLEQVLPGVGGGADPGRAVEGNRQRAAPVDGRAGQALGEQV